jgi:tyrosine-protein kinase Etk/Wzc
MAHDVLETDKPANFLPKQEEDEGINLGEVIATLFSYKWLIMAITAFAVLLGLAKATLDTPVYATDAMLQIQERSQSLGGLEHVPGLYETKLPVLAEMEIIKSRKILGEVVKNLNLQVNAEPHYFPVVGKTVARRFQQRDKLNVSPPWFGLDNYAWGGEIIAVDTFNIPESLEGHVFMVVAGEKGKFQLLYNKQLLLTGEVGQFVSKQLDGYGVPINLFISQMKARPNTQFNLTKKSIRGAIEGVKTTLGVSEKGKGTGILAFDFESTSAFAAMKDLNEIADLYVRQNVEQKSAEAQKTLAFLEQQLPVVKEQLDSSTAALNAYRTRKGSIDLEQETKSVLTSVVELQTQLTLLQQKRDELRQKFTEVHPIVVAVDKQIARLQSQTMSQEKEIGALPETQQVILRLARDVDVSTGLYTTLLNNAQNYRVAKAGAVGDVRIIDRAVLPVDPIKPKKSLIVAISLVLGLMLGIAAAFIKKSLHRGIKDPDVIEKNLNIPVYATVPHSVDQEKISSIIKKNHKSKRAELLMLAVENKDDAAIESLRSLRTTLHFAFLEAKNNIIMISGPSPGVGKSFVSTNLAVMLADTGKKILLIDGDLRKGVIHQALGEDREQGLSDLISGTSTLEQSIRTIAKANFDFLPTGTIPPNPSELLLHERFGNILDTLSQRYDHIIIDSPPILAVTDACIIGRMASVTLMVARSGQHPIRELEQSVKRLSQAGVRLKGIVLNDVMETSSGYAYGYGYSRYVYSYNYSNSGKK